MALAPRKALEAYLDYPRLLRDAGRDRDVSYWRPSSVGALLFNFWD